MNIIDLVNKCSCRVNTEARDKDDLLFKAAELFSRKFKNLSAREIFDALLEREKLGSTGFGAGLAIPHTKFPGLDSFALCILTLKKGVDYGSLDKKKVRVLIGILGPEEKQEEYLRLLAKISKILRHKSILSEMKKAISEAALREALIKATISMEEEKHVINKDRLLIIHIRELRFFDDILNLLLEKEIANAVVTESTGIEHYLTESPLFGGFLNFLAEREGIVKTISVAVNQQDIPPLIEDIEDIMGNLDTHTGIQVMALDISYLRGAITN